jgi:hypothetical protein
VRTALSLAGKIILRLVEVILTVSVTIVIAYVILAGLSFVAEAIIKIVSR